MWLALSRQPLRHLLLHLLLQDPLLPLHLVVLRNHLAPGQLHLALGQLLLALGPLHLALGQPHLHLVDQRNLFDLGQLHHNLVDLLPLLAVLNHLEVADLLIINWSQMLFHLDSHLQHCQMDQIRSLKVILDFLKVTGMYLGGQTETESILYLDLDDLLEDLQEDQAMKATGFPTIDLLGHLLRSTGRNHLVLEDLQCPGLNQMVHQDHQDSGHHQAIQEMELVLIHSEVEETVSPTTDPIGHLLHLTDLQILVLVIAQAPTLMDLDQ